MKSWYNGSELHCDHGPAVIIYSLKGTKSVEKWLQHGELHREDGPAFISYDSQGNIKHLQYYLRHKQAEHLDLLITKCATKI